MNVNEWFKKNNLKFVNCCHQCDYISPMSNHDDNDDYYCGHPELDSISTNNRQKRVSLDAVCDKFK